MSASLPCSLLVTGIDCAAGTWNVTNSSIHGEAEGLFTFATASNVSHDSLPQRQNNLSFTNLYPGATYEVALFYERQSKVFEQCRHQLTICEYLRIWQYLYAHLETFKVCIFKMKTLSGYMLKKQFSFQQAKCQIVKCFV